MEEVVWTSRRARLLIGRRWQPGRLRVTDRAARFTAADGTATELVVLAVRVRRRTLVIQTPDGPVRLRCYAVPAVAALLTSDGRGASASEPRDHPE